MSMKITFENENGEKTVEFDDDVDFVEIIEDDNGEVVIKQGDWEDYEEDDCEDEYDDEDCGFTVL